MAKVLTTDGLGFATDGKGNICPSVWLKAFSLARLGSQDVTPAGKWLTDVGKSFLKDKGSYAIGIGHKLD